jgi:uncharacterized protein (DUF697 family)
MSTETPVETTETKEVETNFIEQTTIAENQVKNYSLGALGVGLIPIPLVDLAALASLQLKMLHSLANTYHVEFKKELGKSAIASLVGGGLSVSASPLAASLAKFIPIIGQSLSAVTAPVLNGAVTYGIGKVFIQHFSSGGTLLDFDPNKMRDYFSKQVEVGKKVVTSMQTKDAPPEEKSAA